MLSYLWLLSRWFTSLLTLRWCESLPLTVGVNTIWHSSYRRGKGYGELQFLDSAQSSQEILGENIMVDSPLQVLPPTSGRSVHDSNTLKSHPSSLAVADANSQLAVLLHIANLLIRAVDLRVHNWVTATCQGQAAAAWAVLAAACVSLAAQCRNAWNVSASRYFRDPAVGNVCTSHRNSPPPHCLSETVTVVSLFSPPSPTRIKISPAPVLTPAPLSEAKSSREMEILQISNIPVPFQTCCGSGYSLGRQAAFRGSSPPQQWGQTSAAHQFNSFQ